MKRFLIPSFILAFIFLGIIILSIHFGTVGFSRERIFSDISELPESEVGLLLGTSKFSQNGGPNPFFYRRIDAAVQLYRNKKIKYILASGDNSEIQYNEPQSMYDALVKRGIPEEDIYLDYAGFSTLDSVVRAKEVFGLNSYTIISQESHNERAIYIALHRGIDAVAFNALEVQGVRGFSQTLREVLARVKAVLDIHILNSQPRFLGDPISIPDSNTSS